ncbi:MAG: hypothetical protein A2036_04125 [Omnitrophica bacterium GWA2_50_21]|nr:MAG: hypothetical protein A2036_04125 [Omnitrophica bacterium GWA2_50_21]
MVFLLQDAHSVPDAQRNIRRLIDHFQQTYGVYLVGVEGLSGDADARLFNSFPDKQLLQSVLDEYRQTGELAGVSEAAIFSRHSSRFYGLENWPLFEQGYVHLLHAGEKEQELLLAIDRIAFQLQKEKEKVYSVTLLQVDSAINDFEAGKINMLDLLHQLAKFIPPKQGSVIDELLTGMEDNQAQQRRRERYAKSLSGQIMRYFKRQGGGNGQIRFNSLLQDFQTERMDAGSYIRELRDLAKENDIPLDLKQKPEEILPGWQKIENMRGSLFFQEIETYEQNVKKALFRTEKEKVLDKLDASVDFLRIFARLEISRKDWLDGQERMRFMAAETSSLYLSLVKQIRDLYEQMQYHRAFYENAEIRDGVFAERIERVMNSTGKKVSVVVTGGFHTHALAQKIKEKGFSYLVVTPRIVELPSKNNYWGYVRGQVSWQNYFEIRGGRISIYDAFVRMLRDKLLERVGERRNEILNQWRNNVYCDLTETGHFSLARQYTCYLDEKMSPEPSLQVKERDNIENFLQMLAALKQAGQLTEENVTALLLDSGMPAVVSAASLGRVNTVDAQLLPGLKRVSAWKKQGISDDNRPELEQKKRRLHSRTKISAAQAVTRRFYEAVHGLLDEADPAVQAVTELAELTLEENGFDADDYMVLVPEDISVNAIVSVEKKVIVFNSGLLAFLQDNQLLTRDAIKFIIGHEVGHALESGRKKETEGEYDPSRFIEEYQADLAGLRAVGKGDDEGSLNPLTALVFMNALSERSKPEDSKASRYSFSVTHPASHHRAAMLYHEIRNKYWRGLGTEPRSLPEGYRLPSSERRIFDEALYGEISFENISRRIREARTLHDLRKAVVFYREFLKLSRALPSEKGGVDRIWDSVYMMPGVAVDGREGEKKILVKLLKDSGTDPLSLLSEQAVEKAHREFEKWDTRNIPFESAVAEYLAAQAQYALKNKREPAEGLPEIDALILEKTIEFVPELMELNESDRSRLAPLLVFNADDLEPYRQVQWDQIEQVLMIAIQNSLAYKNPHLEERVSSSWEYYLEQEESMRVHSYKSGMGWFDFMLKQLVSQKDITTQTLARIYRELLIYSSVTMLDNAGENYRRQLAFQLTNHIGGMSEFIEVYKQLKDVFPPEMEFWQRKLEGWMSDAQPGELQAGYEFLFEDPVLRPTALEHLDRYAELRMEHGTAPEDVLREMDTMLTTAGLAESWQSFREQEWRREERQPEKILRGYLTVLRRINDLPLRKELIRKYYRLLNNSEKNKHQEFMNEVRFAQDYQAFMRAISPERYQRGEFFEPETGPRNEIMALLRATLVEEGMTDLSEQVEYFFGNGYLPDEEFMQEISEADWAVARIQMSDLSTGEDVAVHVRAALEKMRRDVENGYGLVIRLRESHTEKTYEGGEEQKMTYGSILEAIGEGRIGVYGQQFYIMSDFEEKSGADEGKKDLLYEALIKNEARFLENGVMQGQINKLISLIGWSWYVPNTRNLPINALRKVVPRLRNHEVNVEEMEKRFQWLSKPDSGYREAYIDTEMDEEKFELLFQVLGEMTSPLLGINMPAQRLGQHHYMRFPLWQLETEPDGANYEIDVLRWSRLLKRRWLEFYFGNNPPEQGAETAEAFEKMQIPPQGKTDFENIFPESKRMSPKGYTWLSIQELEKAYPHISAMEKNRAGEIDRPVDFMKRMVLERKLFRETQRWSLEEKIQMLLRFFPMPSFYRNEEMLNLIGDPLLAPVEILEKIRPYLMEGAVRDVVAKRLVINRIEHNGLTFQNYDALKKMMAEYFPEDSEIGNELMNELMRDVTVHIPELAAHKERDILTEAATDKGLKYGHLALEALLTLLGGKAPSQKREIFEWMIGIYPKDAEKPETIQELELYHNIEFEGFARFLSMYPKSTQYLFLSVFFTGPNGILRNAGESEQLIADIFQYITGERATTGNVTYVLFKALFDSSLEQEQMEMAFGIFRFFAATPPDEVKNKNELLVGMFVSFGSVGVKAGQYLSKQRGLIPEDLRLLLENLSDQVESIDKRYLVDALTSENGQTVESLEQTIDVVEKQIGSASIKEAYLLRKTDGSRRVVKYLRPMARYEITRKLQVLRKALEAARGQNETLDEILSQVSGPLIDFIEKAALRELDIHQEIEAQRRIGRFSNGRVYQQWQLVVPEIDAELTGSQFFVDEYFEGKPFKEDVVKELEASGEFPAVAKLIVQEVLRQAFILGEYHGDPHAGNILLDLQSRKVCLLDYGNVGTLSSKDHAILMKLLFSIAWAKMTGTGGGRVLKLLTRFSGGKELPLQAGQAINEILYDRKIDFADKLEAIRRVLLDYGRTLGSDIEGFFKVFDSLRYLTDSLSEKELVGIFKDVLIERQKRGGVGRGASLGTAESKSVPTATVTAGNTVASASSLGNIPPSDVLAGKITGYFLGKDPLSNSLGKEISDAVKVHGISGITDAVRKEVDRGMPVSDVMFSPEAARAAREWIAGMLSKAGIPGNMGLVIDMPGEQPALIKSITDPEISSKVGKIILTKQANQLDFPGMKVQRIGRLSSFQLGNVFDVTNSNAVPVLQSGPGEQKSPYLFAVRFTGAVKHGEPFYDEVAEMVRVASGLLLASTLQKADELRNPLRRTNIAEKIRRQIFDRTDVGDDAVLTILDSGEVQIDRGRLFAFLVEHFAEETIARSA